MVVHTSNPSTQEQRQVDRCDFKASLIYIASPITVSQGFKTSKQRLTADLCQTDTVQGLGQVPVFFQLEN